MDAYLLSWLLGFLMPGVPGGVNICETATTRFIQEDIVLLAIVIFRFVNILGDLMAYLHAAEPSGRAELNRRFRLDHNRVMFCRALQNCVCGDLIIHDH